MKIRDFLKEHFHERLQRSSCLAFYGPEERFREVGQDLEEKRKAVDEDDAWPSEQNEFAGATLSLELKTKSRKWQAIQ